MSGSEGSSTKQSTPRVSQGRLDGASEGGNAWLAVTTADARIPIKNQTGENPVFFNFCWKKENRKRIFSFGYFFAKISSILLTISSIWANSSGESRPSRWQRVSAGDFSISPKRRVSAETCST